MLLHRIQPAALALFSLAVLSVAAPAADESALLKILVKKGVLTEKEALGIEAEAQQQQQADKAVSDANKVRLSVGTSELKLYGDTRLRYQYDNRDYQVDPLGDAHDRSPSGNQRSRWRFRLHLNADYKLGEQWFGGVELQTGYASDSANQTFENGFADYPIFISKAFLGYKASEWLTVVAGKQANPFYTTDLVWDPDENPTGLTERFSLHKLFGSVADGTTGYDKDGKALAGVPLNSPWEFDLVAGQFIFDDNSEGGGRDPGTTDHDATTDAYLFETQLIASYAFNKKAKLTIAPGWLVYTAGSVSVPSALTGVYGDFNENSFSDSALVSGATRHLNILLFPGDFTFALGKTPVKLFWDLAYNIEGKARFEDIYRNVRQRNTDTDPDDFKSSHRKGDDLAWLVGIEIGQNKKKGDLSFAASFRRTGFSSVDPNLNDNEFALGELNTQGYKVSLAYSLAAFAEFRLTWMQAWNYNKKLTLGESTTGNAIADANEVDVLQVDLNVKF